MARIEPDQSRDQQERLAGGRRPIGEGRRLWVHRPSLAAVPVVPSTQADLGQHEEQDEEQAEPQQRRPQARQSLGEGLEPDRREEGPGDRCGGLDRHGDELMTRQRAPDRRDAVAGAGQPLVAARLQHDEDRGRDERAERAEPAPRREGGDAFPAP